MDLKQIKELMAAMEKSGVKKILLKEKAGFELQIEMPDEFSSVGHHPAAHSHQPMFIPHPIPKIHDFSHVQPSSQGPHFSTEEKSVKQVDGKFITSPMVGTFYNSPSPEHAPFVKVGDRIEEGMVVCIIEAMKVMNEVKAGMSGVVAEVCLESGHPIEFGTKLFRIV